MEQDHAVPDVSPDAPHGAAGSQADGLLGAAGSQADGLLGRLEVIESQPIEQRAARFDQLAEELLAELQRSDGIGGSPRGEGA